MKLVTFFTSKGLFLGYLTLLLFLPSTVTAETITIAGTGDSQLLLRQLAQAFQQQHPESHILVPNSVGSGGGIKLLLAGRSELARIARPLKPKEQAKGLEHRIFAYSPVVFVANLPDNCLQNITANEVKEIYLGTLNNWNQLANCKDHKLYVAHREDGDSARMVLEENIAGLKEIDQPAGRTIYSTPEAFDTLNRYEYSFGYLPSSQVQKDTLNPLSFEGVFPTVENVQQGRYNLAVPLGIAWRGEPTGVAKLFLDFLDTPEARQLMRKLNTVPAKPE